MTDKEFRNYAFDKMRQGLSESQIARSLGMSLAHFIGRLNGVDVDKVDPPKKETPAMSLAHFMERPNGVDVDKVDPPKKEKKEKPKKEPTIEEPIFEEKTAEEIPSE